MITFRHITGVHQPTSADVGQIVRVFREARRGTLQFLVDLHSADEDRAYVAHVMLSPQNQVWVAEEGAGVVGFIAFGGGWVHQLYVTPAFQGRGVGRRLLGVAQGASASLQLWAFAVNERAIRFYERGGFRVVERTDGAGNEAKRPDVRMAWDGA